MRKKCMCLMLASVFVILAGCELPQHSTSPNRQAAQPSEKTARMVDESSIPKAEQGDPSVTESDKPSSYATTSSDDKSNKDEHKTVATQSAPTCPGTAFNIEVSQPAEGNTPLHFAAVGYNSKERTALAQQVSTGGVNRLFHGGFRVAVIKTGMN